MIQMTNIDFIITCKIAIAADPFNGLFENITFDTFRLFRGFEMTFINRNYPEAVKQDEVLFNNMRAITARKEIVLFASYILEYTGPRNATISNLYLTDFYNIVSFEDEGSVDLLKTPL